MASPRAGAWAPPGEPLGAAEPPGRASDRQVAPPADSRLALARAGGPGAPASRSAAPEKVALRAAAAASPQEAAAFAPPAWTEHPRWALAPSCADDVGDGQLLDRFILHKDESAFDFPLARDTITVSPGDKLTGIDIILNNPTPTFDQFEDSGALFDPPLNFVLAAVAEACA